MSAMAMPEPQPKRRAQEQQKAQEVQAQMGQKRQPVGEASASYSDFDVAYAAEPGPEPGAGVGGSGGIGVRSGGGGTSRGEGQSMSAVMDELLGSDIGVPLGSLGSACAQVADAMAQGAEQSFLAGVFWWLFTKSSAYLDTASRLGAGTYVPSSSATRRGRGMTSCSWTRSAEMTTGPRSSSTPFPDLVRDGFSRRVGRTSQQRAAPSRTRRCGGASDALRNRARACGFVAVRRRRGHRARRDTDVRGLARRWCSRWGTRMEPVATLGAYFGDQDVLATDNFLYRHHGRPRAGEWLAGIHR